MSKLEDLPFPPGEHIESRVPDVMDLREAGVAAAASELESWRVSSAFTSQLGGQRLLGTVGAEIGFSFNEELSMVRDAVEEPIREVASELAGALDPFVDALEETAMAAAQTVVQAIPIVNLIANVLFKVGGLVRRALDQAKQYDRDAVSLRPPPTFEPRGDEDFFNLRILDRVSTTKDWTDIFLPLGVGIKTTSYQENFFALKTTAPGPNNYYVFPADADPGYVQRSHKALRGSVIPGADLVFEGWQGFGEGSFAPTGEFYPTARSEGPQLWQSVNKPSSPSMYTVDALELISEWRSFFGNVIQWLEDTDQISPKFKSWIWRAQLVDVFGLKRKSSGDGWSNHDIAHSVPLEAAAALLANQRKALEDPVTCAYVDRTYGALKNDMDMVRRWEKGRRALLEGSPDVLNVDLGMLPTSGGDAFEFRMAVQRAKSRLSGESAPERPILKFDFEVPPAPTKPSGEPSGSAKAGGNLIPVVLAGVGGYFLARKFLR